MEFTKITNRFWKKFIVADWKAEEMINNKEISIKDCEKVKVESSANTEKPQTKAEFEAVAPKATKKK